MRLDVDAPRRLRNPATDAPIVQHRLAAVARAVDQRVVAVDRQHAGARHAEARVVDQRHQRKVELGHAAVEVGAQALEVVPRHFSRRLFVRIDAVVVHSKLEQNAMLRNENQQSKSCKRATNQSYHNKFLSASYTANVGWFHRLFGIGHVRYSA